jgi:hypothetical protein
MTDTLNVEAPKAEENNLVVRGTDGDPLPHPTGTRMIEKESYERVIEGLKMSADACMHLAKQEPQSGQIWKDVGLLLDRMRLEACKLAGLVPAGSQSETAGARGNPYAWKRARQRFLDGLRQATGGMRQLATCFRGDFRWSMMAQQLERREAVFRALLVGRPVNPSEAKLILPPGYVRH